MIDLPNEVWFYIAEFIPDNELLPLMDINPIFFNLWMYRRYGDVTLDTGDRKAKKLLARLCDPFVARRIKRLCLHLNPVRENIRIVESHQSATQFLRTHIRGAFQRVIRSRPPSPDHTNKLASPSHDVLSNMLVDLATIFPFMINVDDFRIVTWTVPSSYDLQPFYASAWSSFGNKLLKVSLCSNLNGWRVLVDSNPTFNILQSLEVEFSDNILVLPIDEASILSDVVVPFVNKLSPQVKTFKVRSWAKLDLSSFFLNVCPFPLIEEVLIRLPFNDALREDASGLRDFLYSSSATLRKAVLRLTPSGLALHPESEEPLCKWLLDCVSDPRCFSNVQYLDICPTNIPTGINILYQGIQHSMKHLNSFVVRDRYLLHDEVINISKALKDCENLTLLRLNVWKLSADMFDSFALNLPCLHKLWLSVGETVAVDPSVSASLNAFRDDMSSRKYEKWKLWDLTIWQSGSELDGSIMLALARSIPSVRSFWDRGHMELET